MADSNKSIIASPVKVDQFQGESIDGHQSVLNGKVSNKDIALDKPDGLVTRTDAESSQAINSHSTSGTMRSANSDGGEVVRSPISDEPACSSVPIVNEATTMSGTSMDGPAQPNNAVQDGQVSGPQDNSLEPVKEAKSPRTSMYASKYAPSPTLPPDAPRAPAFVAKFQHLPRAPRRGGYNGYQNHHQQQYDPREDIRMLEVKLREAHQKLDYERKAQQAALATADARAQKDCETAIEKLANELLGQKISVARQEDDVRKQEPDIAARLKLIRNIEFILAIGQKQFADAEAGAETQTIQEFVNVNEEIIRERVIHEMNRRDRKVGAHLITKAKELDIREADLEMREKGYQPLLAQNIEKLRAKMLSDIEEEITIRIGKAEYERGFAEGKGLGTSNPPGHAIKYDDMDELQRASYDQGYAACFAMFKRLKELETGQLSHNSPELTNMFDPCHPDSLFARGMRIGQRESVALKQPLHTSSQSATLPMRTANGQDSLRPHKPHPYAHLNGRAHGLNTNHKYTPGPLNFRDALAADPTFGVPHYGTRTADSPSCSSFEHTPPTSKTTTTTASKSTVENGEPEHVQVPNFAGSKLLSFAGRDTDEKVHKEDEQVVLIDLY